MIDAFWLFPPILFAAFGWLLYGVANYELSACKEQNKHLRERQKARRKGKK